MTNDSCAAILEAVEHKKITASELARILSKMTPEEYDKVKAKMQPSAIGRLRANLRKHRTPGPGRNPIMRECPHCKTSFSSRAFIRHEPSCFREHHPGKGRAGRPEGWRKGDGSYLGFSCAPESAGANSTN